MTLSHDDRIRVQAACLAANARTCARFELVAVPVADRYALFPVLYGAIAAMAALAVMALFWPLLPLRTAFFAGALVFAAVSIAFEWLPLRLLAVPRHIKHAHAREMAHRAFAARVLAQADRKTGILLFVALGERYVEVVTDRDVDLRIPQKTWDAIIAEFAATAKLNRIADGLVTAAEASIKVLEEHYPRV